MPRLKKRKHAGGRPYSADTTRRTQALAVLKAEGPTGTLAQAAVALDEMQDGRRVEDLSQAARKQMSDQIRKAPARMHEQALKQRSALRSLLPQVVRDRMRELGVDLPLGTYEVHAVDSFCKCAADPQRLPHWHCSKCKGVVYAPPLPASAAFGAGVSLSSTGPEILCDKCRTCVRVGG